MGLIDFVKDAGKGLFARVGGQEQVDTDAMRESISKHGFQIDNLSLNVADDVATVGGTAASQADKEKVVVLVGNTKGIARVNDQLRVPAPAAEAPPAPEGTYYEVKSGDSLSKIAKTAYGDAMKYPVIFEANKPMLKDPNKIYPGQILRIPPL